MIRVTIHTFVQRAPTKKRATNFIEAVFLSTQSEGSTTLMLPTHPQTRWHMILMDVFSQCSVALVFLIFTLQEETIPELLAFDLLLSMI